MSKTVFCNVFFLALVATLLAGCGRQASPAPLLVAEAQYDTRLARLNVRTRQIRTSDGRETGDNAYAPGGAFYARPNAEFPYMGRGIEVCSWAANTGLAQSLYDGDVMQVAWSPDGRWVEAVATHGAIVLWPTNLKP